MEVVISTSNLASNYKNIMIQRPQTLLLIGAAIVLLVSFFLPFWELNLDEVQSSLNAFSRTISKDGETTTKSIAYMSIVGFVAVISIVFNIFKYNNRALQMKLSSVGNLLIGAHIVLFLFMVVPAAKVEAGYEGSLTLGAFLPLGAFLLNTIAKFLIKKDEDLVKSVDRIR